MSPDLNKYFPFYSVTLKKKLSRTQEAVDKAHKESGTTAAAAAAANARKGISASRPFGDSTKLNFATDHRTASGNKGGS